MLTRENTSFVHFLLQTKGRSIVLIFYSYKTKQNLNSLNDGCIFDGLTFIGQLYSIIFVAETYFANSIAWIFLVLKETFTEART